MTGPDEAARARAPIKSSSQTPFGVTQRPPQVPHLAHPHSTAYAPHSIVTGRRAQ